MPNEENGYSNITKYCPVEKSIQLPLVIYADFEHSFEKQDNSKNDPQNSYNRVELSTIEISKHLYCKFSIFIEFAHDDFLLQSSRLFR